MASKRGLDGHALISKMKLVRKNLTAIFAVVVLSVGFLIYLVDVRQAQANFLENLWRSFFSSFSPATNTTPAEMGQGSRVTDQEVELYKPVLDYERAVVEAVKKVSPAVVSITISKNVPVIEQCPYSPFGNLPPGFEDFFGGDDFFFSQPCQKGTELREVGSGSGFIISADGLIITNKHVVLDKEASYTVFTNDGKKYDAKVLARDPSIDLAVVKIPASGLPIVVLGDSDALELGQTSIAIGNALGEFRNTVSVGVISGLARNVTAGGAGFTETIQGVIQTDAAINPGNSGGPLLNLRGEVVGMNTAVASGAENIGFAIPINQAKRAIESVRKTGEIQSPYIGVRYIMLNEEVAKKQKLSVEYGALIRGTEDGPGVIPGSPAEKAGLLAEDVILELNGRKIDQDNPLGLAISRFGVGDTVTLKIQRGEKELSLQVVLGKRPKE